MKSRLTVLTIAALATGAGLSHAEDDLARMERLSMAMSERMIANVAAEFPDAKDVLPNITWTDAMATAAECSLQAYRDRIGDDGVDEMLANMEALVARETLTMAEFAEEGQKISPLPTDQQQAIEAECGMGKASMESMMADPNFVKFTAFMMQAMQNGEQ